MKDIRVTRPTQVDVDANFPVSGRARNIVTAGDGTGTPWSKDIINDRTFGWQERVLSLAGIVADGNEENASQSQIADALEILIKITSSGYNAAGSFQYGFTYTSDTDVGVYQGQAYKYVGANNYPVEISALTNPVGNSDYEVITYSSKPSSTIINNDNSNAQNTYDLVKSILVSQGLSGAFGYFADGFTVNDPLDVGIDASFQFWKYTGAETLPYEVPVGTDPSTGDWELIKFNLASSITNHKGGSVQDLTNYLSFRSFGCVCDGETIDTTGAQNAAAYCLSNNIGLRLDDGDNLLIDDTLDLRKIRLDIRGSILVNFTNKIGVIVGGSASSRKNKTQFIEAVDYHSSVGYNDSVKPSQPTVRASGVKGQQLSVLTTPYFQIWAQTETDYADSYSSAYSSLHHNFIPYYEINGLTSSAGVAWVNELDINLTSCKNFLVDSQSTDEATYPSYIHNNNRVYGGTFEGASSESENININVGRGIRFRDVRAESWEGARFGEKTYGCSVDVSWTSSNPIDPLSYFLNEDLGDRNVINVEQCDSGATEQTILHLTGENFDQDIFGVNRDAIVKSGNELSLTAFNTLYLSPLIPFDSNTIVRVSNVSQSFSGFRYKIYGYDATGALVDEPTITGCFESSGNQGDGAFKSDGSGLSYAADTPTRSIYFTKNGLSVAKFFKIEVLCGSLSGNIASLSVSVKQNNQADKQMPSPTQTNGMTKHEIKLYAPSLSATNIAAGTYQDVIVNYTGVRLGYTHVSITPSGSDPAGVIIECFVSGDDEITVRRHNTNDAQATITSARPYITIINGLDFRSL